MMKSYGGRTWGFSSGLLAPWTIWNNRFPVAKVWGVNPAKGICEPVSDWIRLDRYN